MDIRNGSKNFVLTNSENIFLKFFSRPICQFLNSVFWECQRKKITEIYFVAREGITLKKIFDEIQLRYNGMPPIISTKVLYVNRGVLQIACLSDDLFGGDRFELEEVKKITGPFFFKALSSSGISLSNTSPQAVCKFFKVYRQSVRDYLNEIVDQGMDHITICDVGWGGTIEKYLDKMLPTFVNGFYLGTDFRYHKERGGIIFNSNDKHLINSIYNGFGVIEHFLAPQDIGTVIGYKKNPQGMTIPLLDSNFTFKTGFDIEKVLSMMVKDFFDWSSNSVEEYLVRESQKYLYDILARPTKEIANLIVDEKFDFGDSNRNLIVKINWLNLGSIYLALRSVWYQGSLSASGLRWLVPIFEKLTFAARRSRYFLSVRCKK